MLPLTGERTVPGISHENYWFRRHEIAYLAAQPWLTGADVLEAGAGEGYGAALVAEVARSVVAVDYDQSAVAHLRRRYPRIDVVRGNLAALPLPAGRFDAVVNMQTIEHLWDQPRFLAECARVLRPAGTLLISTPNRLTFSPGLDKPLNPFHTRELAADELGELLAPHFTLTRMYGVRHGHRLRLLDTRFGGLVDAQLAAEPHAWSRTLRRAVAGVRARDFVVREAGINTSLDLFAIATRTS